MKKTRLVFLMVLVLCITFPLKVTPQNSKYGSKLPAKGTIHVLIVFAELVGTCSGGASSYYPSGTAAPLNAEYYLDYVVSASPTTALSRYYRDISLGELNVIGDYYDGTVQVQCSSVGNGSFAYEEAAIAQLHANWQPTGGNYLTKHGLNINDFDDYDNNASDGTFRAPGNPDGKIDCTLILWRNNNNHNLSCGSGWGIRNNMSPTSLVNNKVVDLFGAWDFCPEKLNVTGSYDDFFTIEFFHLIIGGNNFHVGGGAGEGSFMFDGTGSFTTCQGGPSNIVCGWDRNFLDWKGSRQYQISALDQSGAETPSDMSIDVTPNTSYYVLRDFVTVGDAVRIKLPHFNWQSDGDKKNQYLWIENHQMVNEFDHNKGYTACTPWVPGLYCYIQAGKDLISGSNVYGGSNESPNQLNDWLFPLPAEGRWDYYYDLASKNNNPQACQWTNGSVPYSISFPDGTNKPNPFTGYSDLYGSIDSDGNGIIESRNTKPTSPKDRWQPWYQKWTGIPAGSGSIVAANIPIWGDGLDAFTTTGQKISMATNPSSTPVYTIIEDGPTPQSYDNRSIHLNNLSVEIMNADYYNVGGSGPKSFLIKVRWNDNAITNDVRWCGNIILENDPLDNLGRTMQIGLLPNKTITIDKGLSPVKLYENAAGSGDFSEPSFLHLLNGTTTTLGNGSQIKVINGSTFHVQAGANLIIGSNASVDIDATSFICIEDGANVVFQNPITSKIIINGIAHGWDDNIQNVVLASLPADYYSLNTITTSGTVIMPSSGNVLLQARNSITLTPGTNIIVQPGQSFTARIEDPFYCNSSYDLRTMASATSNSDNDVFTFISDDLSISSSSKKPNTSQKEKTHNSITISPNPNNGTFKISVTKNEKAIGVKELKVFDLMGNTIWQTGSSSNTIFDVDISKYARGIYYVRSINDEGEIEVQKLVKQ